MSVVFLWDNFTASQEVLILSSRTVIAMIMTWQTSFLDQTQDYHLSNTSMILEDMNVTGNMIHRKGPSKWKNVSTSYCLK